jgi:predicted nucleotidyltransferase
MRLTPEQVDAIKVAVREVAGPEARVWLFGSRVDDSARGGDIDLLVKTPRALENSTQAAALVGAKIQLKLRQERNIDVVMVDPATTQQAIHAVALAEGVELT